MSEFKGTPGPWFDGSTSMKRYDITGQDGRVLCQIEAKDEVDDFNNMLITAAPEMLEALTDGVTVDLPELLDWVADRLVHVYGENENIDFVLTLRHRASVCRKAIAKALGE